jgi:hypothetical protein
MNVNRKNRQMLERLLKAAETYVVAVVQAALSPLAVHPLKQPQQLDNARSALLDVLEEIDDE